MVIGIEASHAAKPKRTGVEEYCYQTIQGLKKTIPANVQVILYTHRPLEGALGELPANWSVRVLGWPLSKLWTQLRLSWEFLVHGRPDVFFAPGQLIPFIIPKKTVVTVHDSAFLIFPKTYNTLGRWYLRLMNWLIVRRATTILTPSQFTKDELLRLYSGLAERKIVVTPLGYDAEVAGRFARELQMLLRTLKAGEANLEKGEMRVEANISVSRDDTFGTKVEVKNLNSFRSVERAIQYEFDRQTKLLDAGGQVVQETRGWDENKQATFSQRKKESSHDYRYFPDPDLPKLVLSEIPEFSKDLLAQELPELPWHKRERYVALGLKKDDAEMLVREHILSTFFDRATKGVEPQAALLTANYLTSDIAGKREEGTVSDAWLMSEDNARHLQKLISLVQSGALSSRGAKDTLAHLINTPEDPEIIAKREGLIQQSDSGLLAQIALKVVESNPQVVLDYKAGKEAAMQFLVGQGMKESKGSANPAQLREEIKKALA
jgi:aspartyl-tRNA(Asn)/glutamyl-tRNA(Gln) amidotransferase subunit B